MATHTPGPWSWDGEFDLGWYAHLHAGDHHIGMYTRPESRHLPREQSDANARLIVAAPDLLAVVDRLLKVIGTIREEQTSTAMGFGKTVSEKRHRATVYAAEIERQAMKVDDLLDAARAALAKATAAKGERP